VRVLVVEDDVDAAEALRRLLASWGARVEVAHTGSAAIETAASLRPQLVLADLELPDLEASEWVPQVRQQLADVAPLCVAVTGRVEAGDVALARAAGFQLHLGKPVDPARLREVLREVQKAPTARSLE
jgi:CheY-like chemotaxis protein